jgi:GntR family transcriptional regulator
VDSVIDKNSIIPIYYQMIQYIRGQVENHFWNEDDMIPSERELCEKNEISRMTVRQAIESLVNEGILYRKRGIGTFVSRQKVDQVLVKPTNFTADMLSIGMKPSSKTLRCGILSATKEIAKILKINDGDPVIELCRLRLANDKPMAVEQAFILQDAAKSILNTPMDNKSLYSVLKDECGLNIVLAKQTIQIAYSDQEFSRILNIKLDSPTFLMDRIDYLSDNRPIEYVKSYYRADRYKFTVELKV